MQSSVFEKIEFESLISRCATNCNLAWRILSHLPYPISYIPHLISCIPQLILRLHILFFTFYTPHFVSLARVFHSNFNSVYVHFIFYISYFHILILQHIFHMPFPTSCAQYLLDHILHPVYPTLYSISYTLFPFSLKPFPISCILKHCKLQISENITTYL